MIAKLLLDAKRQGQEIAGEQIRSLVAAYVRGEVSDCQMSAFTMAVCCRGMSAAETLALTQAMRDSGATLEWTALKTPTADKHSTGGVGDKLSLISQPIAAACGIAAPSLTGRGLGLTGGTADKMETIPGYVAGLSLEEYRRVVAQCGCSLAMQTPEIAPADKKIYALRDATGTVASIPLIVASILSKKLAEGAQTLVFDVKCGKGAFMKTRQEATALARALVDGARGAGRQSAALVTAMDEPLGAAVGNALEVREALAVLRGETAPADVTELSIALAAKMVALARGLPAAAALELCREKLASGAALQTFAEMVRLHGGDLEKFAAIDYPAPAIVTAPTAGFVDTVCAEAIAKAAFMLGAGRNQQTDAIDPVAGVELLAKAGTKVASGDPLAKIYTVQKPENLPAAAQLVREAYAIAPTPPTPRALILETVE